MSSFLQSYLNDLYSVQQSGKATDERSYYGPLNTLFQEIGDTLRPSVQPIQDVASEGVTGHPDFLLQATNNSDIRLAVEVKGTADELDKIVASDQVGKYLDHYGLCLVTNLRELALVEGTKASRRTLMRLALAKDEKTFWSQRPQVVAAALDAQFDDFLLSALTWKAPITRPVDLASTLARYAREALRRLEQQPPEALAPLRKTLSNALGLHFNDVEGEHFFRSSLVQTLFYGLFSAWVTYHRRGITSEPFTWAKASDYLGIPLLAELFDAIARPQQLKQLTVREPLEWAEAALNRTVWENFEWAFQHGEAINYFYEPFLEAFDPDLRKQLGVWYTPPEIVRYMVARVDTMLREELGIADGLADKRVIILDPCCGTGAYPVEVLRFIAQRLNEMGEDALIGAKIKEIATSRVFGFEIMPAPFVIAHLQIGLLLAELNAPLGETQRAGVYLTNALTGWETTTTLPLPGFPALQQESEASKQVKQREQILVILGNPPYNGYAGIAVEEERTLSDAYSTTKRAPKPQGQGRNDLYVRFFRMAEHKIVDGTGRGVVCFISNYSWLDNLSCTGMRERYLEAFDAIWIDSMNGDKFRTGKKTPDGKPDPSVFSTEYNREGIKPGTAIATLVRRNGVQGTQSVAFRNLWGTTKLAQLSQSAVYDNIGPAVEIGYPFTPRTAGSDYYSWSRLPELLRASFPGVKTSRDDVVVDIDKDRLIRRMEQYFNPAISHEQMRQIAPGAMDETVEFKAEATRDQLRKRGFLPNNIVRYCYRPFDVRWLYWEPESKLLDRNRADYFPQVFNGNVWIEARQREAVDHFSRGYITTTLSDQIGNGMSNFFPLYLKQGSLYDKFPNLSPQALTYLNERGGTPEDFFYHLVAILHTPSYRSENDGALIQDYPRILLPATLDTLATSAILGKQIAALLDPEIDVSGITSGKLRGDLRPIGGIARVGGGRLDPEMDFVVNVRWGIHQGGGITMPSKGKLTKRPYTSEESAALNVELLGDTTLDIYLNNVAYWRNIPKRVWEYTISGYQVIKKWLSYRESALLGRPLKMEEVEEVTRIARRIAAILLLERELDANYAAVKAATVTL